MSFSMVSLRALSCVTCSRSWAAGLLAAAEGGNEGEMGACPAGGGREAGEGRGLLPAGPGPRGAGGGGAGAGGGARARGPPGPYQGSCG